VKTHVTTALAVVGLAMLAILVFVLQDTDDPSARGGTDAPTVTASATTPRTTLPSAASGSASPSEPTAAGRITTTSSLYFGIPFETIEILGTYDGADSGTTLRLQMRQGEEWTEFPLPVVTRESGTFRAYVELGRGQYKLRVVDPVTGMRSETVTLLLL
jgi:hypothetical protein